VDNLSWRWVFYVNLPIGLISLLVTALALPETAVPRRARLDWLGAALITLATSALVLLTSLGGNTFAWSSPYIVGLAVIAVLGSIAFVLVEQRAEEPLLAPRFFKESVFAISSALSFIIGAIMLGSLNYLPTFMQNAKGDSATQSGLQLLPLMAGLLLSSTASGQLVSRTGRYRVFPIASMAVTIIGLFLMSTMAVGTPSWLVAVYLFVFGLGLGLGLQVLTVAVQNVVARGDLGAATSGVNFFRSIGSVIGVAVFGAIYTNTLTADAGAVGAAPDAYAAAIHNVFIAALPIAAVAFVLSWFLKEVPLRSASDEANIVQTLGEPSTTIRRAA
jgi:MFS family permease